MYKLKQVPEDFVVNELIKPEFLKESGGDYTYYILKKKDFTTMKAIEIIANKLNIKPKNIGFAGNKDRKAVTAQIISVFRGKRSNFNLNGISLEYAGSGEGPVSLGDLEGNNFEIAIRDLADEEIKKLEIKNRFIPNYFGSQRFSKNNYLIGRAVVKKEFKKALGLILENEKEDSRISINIKNIKDPISALRKIPKKLLMLYVHSYQSHLFNKTMGKYLSFADKNEKIPLIGFGLEVNNNSLKKIIEKIMEEEKITERDFIIREIPELSAESIERSLFIELTDFKINEISEDELNKGKKKALVSFSLPKGSYATVVIDCLLQN